MLFRYLIFGISFSLFLISGKVKSQASSPFVISAGGEWYSEPNIKMQFTIGEPISSTFSNDTIQLTQGFHQSNYWIYSVNDVSDLFELRIYPNPTRGELFIETTNNNKSDYTLFDQLGKEVAKGQFIKNCSLNIESFEGGVFYFQIRNEDHRKDYKIVKQ